MWRQVAEKSKTKGHFTFDLPKKIVPVKERGEKNSRLHDLKEKEDQRSDITCVAQLEEKRDRLSQEEGT